MGEQEKGSSEDGGKQCVIIEDKQEIVEVTGAAPPNITNSVQGLKETLQKRFPNFPSQL